MTFCRQTKEDLKEIINICQYVFTYTVQVSLQVSIKFASVDNMINPGSPLWKRNYSRKIGWTPFQIQNNMIYIGALTFSFNYRTILSSTSEFIVHETFCMPCITFRVVWSCYGPFITKIFWNAMKFLERLKIWKFSLLVSIRLLWALLFEYQISHKKLKHHNKTDKTQTKES